MKTYLYRVEVAGACQGQDRPVLSYGVQPAYILASGKDEPTARSEALAEVLFCLGPGAQKAGTVSLTLAQQMRDNILRDPREQKYMAALARMLAELDLELPTRAFAVPPKNDAPAA